MADEHLINKNLPSLSEMDLKTKWQSWCRLCAKRELGAEERSSIFMKNECGKPGSEIANAIGKYFWVNIKANDEISLCVCWECRQLLKELVDFTERVNKVQTFYCLLENIKPKTMKQALDLKTQCGLIDEGWQHIIKQHPDEQIPTKPLLIDQQIQTDELVALENVLANDDNSQTEYNRSEEILNILRNENEDCVNQTEEQVGHVYEYVVQGENDTEYIEGSEYAEPANNEMDEDEKPTSTEDDEEDTEIQNTDILQHIKDEDIENDNIEKQMDTYNIIENEEDLELQYESSSRHLQPDDEDDDVEHSIEMLEDEDDDLELLNTSEPTHNITQIEALSLLKGKRGRPSGVKNSNSYKFRFDCKECKRSYKNPNLYRKHMNDLHSVNVDEMPEFQPNFNKCTVCDKPFATQSTLKMHMRHHLPDEEKYNIPCPYCERKFSQVGAMRTHVNGIHHQMKPFICDQCGRACKTMAALNEHLLVHTNDCPFECEVCHRRFKNKPRLKTHMDIHNKSAYKCEDCGLELNTKRTLLQHRLVHSDVKRFKCEFCDAAFKRSKALKNHLILHSGLRPYKCNFCSKSFSNGSNCRAHKRRTHPRELAEDEANGKEPERVPIPKLEELKSAKSVLVQPRKIKRHAGGLPNQLRKLLRKSSEEGGPDECQDYEDSAENCENVSEFQYEVYKTEIEDSNSMVDIRSEACEETVIYEIIDEI